MPKRDNEEIYATAELLPSQPYAEAYDDLVRRLDEKDVLIYKVDRMYQPLEDRYVKAVKCTCSACGNEFYAEYQRTTEGCHSGGYSAGVGFVNPQTGTVVGSHENVECPYCLKGVMTVHTSKFSRHYTISSGYVATVHNIRGHLVVLSWYADKDVDKDGIVHYMVRACEGVMIVKGCIVRVDGYTRCMSSASWHDWQVRPVFKENFGRWQRSEFVYEPDVVYETEAANSGLNKYIETAGKDMRIGAYLAIWCKWPAIENLVTSGNAEFVAKCIEEVTSTCGYYYCKEEFRISELKNYINFKKVKPHEMLRCKKHDVGVWREVGIKRFAFRGYVYEKYGVELGKEKLDACYNEGLGAWYDVLSQKKGFLPPLERTFNYFEREREKWRKAHKVRKGSYDYVHGCLITPRYLADYWKMLFDVYAGYPEELKYPKDLEIAHDRVRRLVKTKEDEKLREKFVKREKELLWLSFTDKNTGLFIRPAKTQLELIEEGEKLSHCVGGYASSHVSGRTAILFIRKIKEPDAPYFTLEYREGTVAQNRGRRNCKRTSDVVKFEAKWLDHIKRLKGRTQNERTDKFDSVRAGA